MKTSKPLRWGAKAAVVFAVATWEWAPHWLPLRGGQFSIDCSQQAPTRHQAVTLQFWNAYNDVTETPVMNGVVILPSRVRTPASR